MHFHIDPNSSRPIIRQVIEQIQWQIVGGRIKPGDRLPSIRELAKQLEVNPTTVTRIYSELAAAGVVVLRQGQGAFVAETSTRLQRSADEVQRRMSELARTLVIEGLKQGLSKREIDEIVAEEFRQIRSKSDVSASDRNT